jgi:hypothetical protein
MLAIDRQSNLLNPFISYKKMKCCEYRPVALAFLSDFCAIGVFYEADTLESSSILIYSFLLKMWQKAILIKMGYN